MRYDALQAQTRAELDARTDFLKADVAAWTNAARATAMGLSTAQHVVLVRMTDGLLERQCIVLKKFPGAITATAFADVRAEFIVETTGGNELWQFLRSILEQQEDAAFRASVQAATRIAGDCYAHCIRKARLWGAIAQDRLREQPVVYLEAADSPATASRGVTVQSLSITVREYRNLALPLPIALLPYDYAKSIWTFCALHHETGHNLDKDLTLLSALRGALPDVVPVDQEPNWRRWSAEILADALGVTLGGAGFAVSLATDALMLGPAARYQVLDPDAVHPPFLLRVALLIAMLRRAGVPGLALWADQIEEAWNETPRPAWMEPLVQAAPKVSEVFLTRKLAVLADHCLLDFNSELAAEHDEVTALAHYFATGNVRPDPNTMRARLVPAAAQLAIRALPSVDATALSTLHTSAMNYLGLVPPGGVLAAGGDTRDYHRELMLSLHFPMQRSEAQ